MNVWFKIVIPYVVALLVIFFLGVGFWRSNRAYSVLLFFISLLLLLQLFFGRKMQEWAFELHNRFL